MPFDLVIRHGRAVTPDGVIRADIGIEGGEITAIAEGLSGGPVLDATDRLVLPGGVDPHAHIEQMSGMGLMNADTFESATRSAAMGGTTSVISFAAQHKGQALGRVVEEYAALARRGAMIDYAFHLSVSDIAAPDFDADLARLVAAGHRSIKVFTTYNIKLEDREILEVLAAARRHGALVCVHAENDGLIGWAKQALLAAGMTRPAHHAISHPRLAEVEAVSRLCHFAEFFGHPVMLFHISTREGAEVLRNAQARGVPVWGETCPHYLLMTSEVLDREGIEGAKWMCSPPQREATDQQALWAALEEGVLQIISSDHAPYRFDETGKLSAGPDADFTLIANGLPGLETRLPLIFAAMVSPDGAGVERFVELTSAAPARVYGLAAKGSIEIGKDADLAIWDPGVRRQYGADDLHDNVGYNPWEGREAAAPPQHVLSRGKPIVEDGRCVARPGQGRWIARDAMGVQTSTGPAPELHLIEGTP
ncbi:MAG: dihydropyrimidinase [Pseudomonadota bacterium]